MTEKLAAEIVKKSGIMRDTGMTSATPKPRVGEQAGSRTPLVDAIIKKFPHSAQLEELARNLEAERNVLLETMEEMIAWCDHFAPITYPILTRARAVLAKTRSTDRRE